MANISNQRMLDLLINLKDKAIEVAAINSVTLATNEYVANMKNLAYVAQLAMSKYKTKEA